MTTSANLQVLQRIRGSDTLYELVAKHPDGRSYLIRYTHRRSRDALLKNLRHYGETVARLMGPTVTFASHAADGATVGDWRVSWTGRTERDALRDGELPFIGKED